MIDAIETMIWLIGALYSDVTSTLRIFLLKSNYSVINKVLQNENIDKNINLGK